MQDRYTGDLGDFSKLGILRALKTAGLSIGVNWYLTPDENHNGDGRHVKYLYQEEYKTCDAALWLGMTLSAWILITACLFLLRLGNRKKTNMSCTMNWQITMLSIRV